MLLDGTVVDRFGVVLERLVADLEVELVLRFVLVFVRVLVRVRDAVRVEVLLTVVLEVALLPMQAPYRGWQPVPHHSVPDPQ